MPPAEHRDHESLPSKPRVGLLARRTLAAQSDERLVTLMREGHEPAFEEIVRRYRGSLTAFAAAFIPHHRAEDVVQNSLLRAHKALLADDRDVALRAWLFTIVRNGCLNAIRDEPEWQELDPAYDGVPQPPAIAERNEELHTLVTAICALPEAQRRALVGRELEGQGHAQLAAELNTTSTAIRGLIFRARMSLRDALGALVPLPVIRMILAGGAGGGAGTGAGLGTGLGVGAAGLGGSGGLKIAAAISAAAVVLGGGIAVERRANGDREGAPVAEASSGAREAGSERFRPGAASAPRPVAEPSASSGAGGRSLHGGAPASGDERESDGGDRSGSDDSGSSDGHGGGEDERGDDVPPAGGGDGPGPGGHAPPPPGGDDGGSHGGRPEQEPPDDDLGGGPGPETDDSGSDDPLRPPEDQGDSGALDDPPEVPEIDAPDDDRPGPSGGDHSGHGAD